MMSGCGVRCKVNQEHACGVGKGIQCSKSSYRFKNELIFSNIAAEVVWFHHDDCICVYICDERSTLPIPFPPLSPPPSIR